jgi:uncharacterized protein (TIGR00270 family)
MNCDLCGAENASFVILVEGTKMRACEKCSKFGKVLQKPVYIPKAGPKGVQRTMSDRSLVKEKGEPGLRVVPGFGSMIKKKREHLNLNQEDFAKMLNIKLSMLHQIEGEHLTPNIETAKMIEKRLGIKITEQDNDETVSVEKKKDGPLTIGDVFVKNDK